MVVRSPVRPGLDMTRATVSLIAVFALIAACCVAFGTYFSSATLTGAYRATVEARFEVTAARLCGIVENAASLGIALPVQRTLAGLLQREARLEPGLFSIDITDEHGVILFSSDTARQGLRVDLSAHNQVVRAAQNDFDAVIGRVVVRYDPLLLEAGAGQLQRDLWAVAWPTIAGAIAATILAGIVLASGLRRAVRRAAEPRRWPGAARMAVAELDAAHQQVAARATQHRGGGA